MVSTKPWLRLFSPGHVQCESVGQVVYVLVHHIIEYPASLVVASMYSLELAYSTRFYDSRPTRRFSSRQLLPLATIGPDIIWP